MTFRSHRTRQAYLNLKDELDKGMRELGFARSNEFLWCIHCDNLTELKECCGFRTSCCWVPEGCLAVIDDRLDGGQ